MKHQKSYNELLDCLCLNWVSSVSPVSLGKYNFFIHQIVKMLVLKFVLLDSSTPMVLSNDTWYKAQQHHHERKLQNFSRIAAIVIADLYLTIGHLVIFTHCIWNFSIRKECLIWASQWYTDDWLSFGRVETWD